MQQPVMPPPPAPQKRTPWIAVGAAVIVTAIVVGVIANVSKDSVAAPPSPVPTVAPSPSPVELPAATPVVDPMDAAVLQLHQDIYVQQFCNMADSSGIDHFADLIEIGKPWKTNSIGSAWVAAQNKTGYSITELATEVYGRYC